MKLEIIVAQTESKTVYRNGKLQVKVFNKPYSKEDVLSEALNQARVENTNLNVPKLHEVMMVRGKWAIVSDFIVGKTLQELMDEDPEHLDDYLRKFVEIQLDIHKQKCPLLPKARDTYNEQMMQADLEYNTAYELHTRLESRPRHKKLLHGDYNPSNVIITESGEAYVIDWAHAMQGNASADVAHTYLDFCLAGKKAFADRYLELYAELSEIDLRYIQSWMPIVAAAALSYKPEKDRDFLLHWIDVMDY